MSDSELITVLLGALAVALLLRRFNGTHTSGPKVGLASANAAIAGVAVAVLGGLLVKFFRGSIAEVPGVVLVVCGFVAMGIGLAMSLISMVRALAGGSNSKAGAPIVPRNAAAPNAGNDDSNDFDYLEYRLISNAIKHGNPSTFNDIDSNPFGVTRDSDLVFGDSKVDDDFK